MKYRVTIHKPDSEKTATEEFDESLQDRAYRWAALCVSLGFVVLVNDKEYRAV